MIEAKNLRKTFGKNVVLSGAEFEAREGEITLLIGANGAGKSTTIRMLAGLCLPDEGTLRVSGICSKDGGERYRARISYLPQNPAFHPGFGGRRILEFYARLRGVPHARVQEVIELAGLEGHADKPTGILSGGLRQRLGLALLLLPDAPVLLLDEPGLSLDPEWRERLMDLLRSEALAGKTVLVATHLLWEWNGRADRCLLCEDGAVRDGVDPARLSQGICGWTPPPKNETPRRTAPARPPAKWQTLLFAVFARELQAATKNRYLQFFAALALGGGFFGVWSTETLESMAHLNLQISLYGVPFFALLFGVSGARMESEEWPLLFSQPMPRATVPLGKFLAGLLAFSILNGLVYFPGLFVGAPPGTTLSLYASSMALAAVFVALGLQVGFAAADRVRALVAGVVVWLLFFAGFDLLALVLAHAPVVHDFPLAWIAMLMANPVDAFRVHGLFALEKIPADMASKAPLAGFWLRHAGACFGAVAAFWTSLFLSAAVRCARRVRL